MIPQHEIEEVLSRADIYEVASEFLPLKKSGAGFTCCCPFHKEKSPSFYVSPTRNIYKCFGCGKGGDIVSFLKEKEGMSFMEAIKYLANKYHVTLHEQTVEETDEQRRARLHKESIQHQYEAVQSFYEDNIRKADKEAVAAYKYAKERWDAEFVKDQGIGYAYTSKGETLYDYAKSHSLSVEILKELAQDGIQAESEAMKELIDTYKDSLDAAKDLYDFQKRLADQTKNVSELQKQLSAYENDNSEETKATVQRLKVDLESALQELDETEYDHYVSDQKKLLDDFYEEYEKQMDERFDEVNFNLSEMIDTINANSADIYTTLKESTEAVGYTMTDEMNNVWNLQKSAMDGNTNSIVSVLTTYSANLRTSVVRQLL